MFVIKKYIESYFKIFQYTKGIFLDHIYLTCIIKLLQHNADMLNLQSYFFRDWQLPVNFWKTFSRKMQPLSTIFNAWHKKINLKGVNNKKKQSLTI